MEKEQGREREEGRERRRERERERKRVTDDKRGVRQSLIAEVEHVTPYHRSRDLATWAGRGRRIAFRHL